MLSVDGLLVCAVGVANFVVAGIYDSQGGSVAWRWIAAVVLWIGFVIAVTRFYYVLQRKWRRPSGALPIGRVVSVYFIWMLGAAGLLTSIWGLDPSPTKSDFVAITPPPTLMIAAFPQIVSNTVALFNSAGMVNATPLGPWVSIWILVNSVAGHTFSVLLFGESVQWLVRRTRAGGINKRKKTGASAMIVTRSGEYITL